MDAEVILQRFNTTTSEQDKDPELRELGDGDSWRQLRKNLDAAIADTQKVEAKRVAAVLHSLQVQNELLHHENEGLRAVIGTRQKHKKKSKVLNLQQQEEYHGGATLWSPSKIEAAREREATKQRDEEEERL